MGKTIDIGGRIHNPEVGNVVTGANEILDDTKNKKQDVINSEVDAALEALDANKQDNLTFDQTPTEDSTNPVTSGGVYAADLALQQAIEAILTLIPSAASALNQLADKSFVNSSIATASATFRGTYNLVSDLHLSVTASHQDIATALASAVSTADNNDYCFVQIPTSDTSSDIRVTERYKFNGTAWAYEYDLNNSGFTATQWEAINSGITALLVTKLGALPTAAELATSLAGKQNVLTFDNVPVSGSDNPVKSGGLYQLFTAIDAKFPSDASASNKLVAENRLAAYVTAIINALDASFDLTSADGHVTFRMTQTNGVIASVQILTSDIASASALTTLGGRVSTNEGDIAALQGAYAALTQSHIQVVQAVPASGNPDTIYRVVGVSSYSDYMFNADALTTPVLMATYNNVIDTTPMPDSENLVSSGGVFESLIDGGLVKKNQGTMSLTQTGSVFIPYTFKSGRKYKFKYLASINSSINVVFISTDQTADHKVNTFPNYSFEANVPIEVAFIANGDANYFHYWTNTAINIQVTVEEYEEINAIDKINDLRSEIESYHIKIGQKNFDFPNGGYVKNDGTIVTLPNNQTYGYAKIPCQNGDAIKAHVFNYGSTYGISFFDVNNIFISGIGNDSGNKDWFAVAPQNAAFVYITSHMVDGGITPWYSINADSENIPVEERNYSERCFFYGKKSPKKPCVNINMDVYGGTSFTTSNINGFINHLKYFGINATTFFCRADNTEIGNPKDYAGAVKLGHEIAIHSKAGDNFGQSDGTPHPTSAEAAALIKGYQDYFFNNGLGYGLGWVTSRGELYEPLFDTVRAYMAYGHTLWNADAKTIDISDAEAVDYCINKRNGDKMKITRVNIENLQADGTSEENTIINNVKALIDATIEANGYLCLYCHGYNALDAPYTCRANVLQSIIQYIKQKLDNYELLVGKECDVVKYFYD